MSPGKSVMDLALGKKYLAWDSSELNDVFTTRDRSIPVIQLRRLYHSDGTEALMVGYFNDLECQNLLRREVYYDGDISEEELLRHIDEQFYDSSWDITPEYYEMDQKYWMHCPVGHVRLEDRTDRNIRRRFKASVMDYIPPYTTGTGGMISCRTIFSLEVMTGELEQNHIYNIYLVSGREKPQFKKYINDRNNSVALVAHYRDWSVGMSAYGIDRKRTNAAACYRLLPLWDIDGFMFIYLSEGVSAVPFRFAWISNKDLDLADCEAALEYWLT